MTAFWPIALALVATASGWLVRMVYDDAKARRAIRRMRKTESVILAREAAARTERDTWWFVQAASDDIAWDALIILARSVEVER